MTTGIRGIMTTAFGHRFMSCLPEGTFDVAFIEPDGTEEEPGKVPFSAPKESILLEYNTDH